MQLRKTLASVAVVLVIAATAHAAPWRSVLYPDSWTPGFADSSGRFLHDWSYAGYHASEEPIPLTPKGPLVDVSKAPYLADATGAKDVTAILQKAIDDVGAKGGGVVYLSPGTFQIRRQPGKDHALQIDRSGVVLRGAGPDKTFLWNASTDMRDARIVAVRPASGDFLWYWSPSDERTITKDLPTPTRSIPIADTKGYGVGDWIVVRADATEAFIAEHGMTGTWTPADLGGPIFYRRIDAIDLASKTLTIDAPTRYELLLRDKARIHRVPAHLSEIGIESLSLGNAENTTSGTGDGQYDTAGTGAYQMHASFVIWMNHVVNGWIRDVRSYRPSSNKKDVHLLSNGIRLDASRFVTVERVTLQNPQYLGEGGNGNLFVFAGSDCLIVDSTAINGRHNYTLSFMQTTGNVLFRSLAKGARLPVDYHQRLAVANLMDNVRVDDDVLEAAFRTCCGHGHPTSQSAFWNIEGVKYQRDQLFSKFIVQSKQVGHGYVIGTRGAAPLVSTPGGNGTEPIDFSEGVGKGDELVPASLYLDQRARRLKLPSDAGPPTPGDASGDAPSPDVSTPDDAVSVLPDPGADSAEASVGPSASDTEGASAGCSCRAHGRRTRALGIGGWTFLVLAVSRIARCRRRVAFTPASSR